MFARDPRLVRVQGAEFRLELVAESVVFPMTPGAAIPDLSAVDGEVRAPADEKPRTCRDVVSEELLVVDRLFAVGEGHDLVPPAGEVLSPGHGSTPPRRGTRAGGPPRTSPPAVPVCRAPRGRRGPPGLPPGTSGRRGRTPLRLPDDGHDR